MATEENKELAEVINRFSEMFDDLCVQRHKIGQERYGPLTFLGNDVIRMMAEELADTANYCRMQFVKIMMLQAHLTNELEDEVGDADVTIGLKAFRGTKEGWKK